MKYLYLLLLVFSCYHFSMAQENNFKGFVVLKGGDTLWSNDNIQVISKDQFTFGGVKINGRIYTLRQVKFVQKSENDTYVGRGGRIYPCILRGKINVFQENWIIITRGISREKTINFIQKGLDGKLEKFTYKNLAKMLEGNEKWLHKLDEYIDRDETLSSYKKRNLPLLNFDFDMIKQYNEDEAPN